ncbi:hypothetical protein F5Y17DRAFT_167921 [Xylariaceae sp. FL0594]|nr:hypothetical protein F5Y17DRAFT_167921 [Xylariaceae sp. FL0594]
MVLCSLHLISLQEGASSLSAFLTALHDAGIEPVVRARVLRWMILPKEISAGYLLARNIRWDALLILPSNLTSSTSSSSSSSSSESPPLTAPSLLESIFAKYVSAEWKAEVGTSSKLLSSYASTNAHLLNASPTATTNIQHMTPLTPAPDPDPDQGEATDKKKKKNKKKASSSSPQNLEPSRELSAYISSLPAPLRRHPVSMLNLLSFNEGKKADYVRYGQEFSSRVGSRYGGRVKIVGKVTSVSSSYYQPNETVKQQQKKQKQNHQEEKEAEDWDEIAFVHYPSIVNFAAMAGDADYQDVNRKYRLGALRDTFILCVLEVGLNGEPVALGRKSVQSKL